MTTSFTEAQTCDVAPLSRLRRQLFAGWNNERMVVVFRLRLLCFQLGYGAKRRLAMARIFWHGPVFAASATALIIAVPARAVALPVVPADSLFSLCLAGLASLRPDDVWSSWSFAPETVVPLILAAVGYGFGMRLRLKQGPRDAWREASLFTAGLALLAVALVSPLCRMAATLAWAHMVQHVILVALAPPLLLMGAAGPVLGALLPQWLRARSRRERRALPPPPAVAAGLYGGAIWFWHIPLFYQAALTSEATHVLMYASLLAAALAFWAAILASRQAGPERSGLAVLVLLGTLIHTGLLGALISFSREIWFPILSPGSLAWGLTPLEDQQLAGMIMWVPMGAVYLIAAIALVATGLARLGQQRHGEAARPLSD